jgi:hypothetical protein
MAADRDVRLVKVALQRLADAVEQTGPACAAVTPRLILKLEKHRRQRYDLRPPKLSRESGGHFRLVP